jgi:hypothetical protein
LYQTSFLPIPPGLTCGRSFDTSALRRNALAISVRARTGRTSQNARPVRAMIFSLVIDTSFDFLSSQQHMERERRRLLPQALTTLRCSLSGPQMTRPCIPVQYRAGLHESELRSHLSFRLAPSLLCIQDSNAGLSNSGTR